VPQEDIVPVRNQVLITQPLNGLSWKGCFHMDEGYIYFRNVGDRILIGGARHKYPEGEIGQLGENKENLGFLLDFIKEHLITSTSEIVIDKNWSGILSGGSDRLPIVKRVGEHVTIAARLSGMGVAIGLDIGEEAATLVLG